MATQDPKHNAMPPSEPPKKRLTSAEVQKRYRQKVQRESQAYRQIRDIIVSMEAES